MSTSLQATGRFRVSCFHCRDSKRRCDKSLPACQLCRRKDLECRYPQRRGQKAASPIDDAPNTDDAAARRNSHNSYHDTIQSEKAEELRIARAIHFLAPVLFRDLHLQLQRMEWDMPAEIEVQLGGRQQMQDTTKEFLLLTRSWMPIINGKRHLAAVLNPLAPLPRPAALLALCMKLCCLSVDETKEKRVLYDLVKKFYAEVEVQEDSCVQVMQAAVFIAVFEMGDAIFPAAYLTVGALARYGMAMGMYKINQDALGKNCGTVAIGASWADIEEMRRVWWGTLILDRLVNMSQPSRGLSTADPSFEDFLPVDDEVFHNQSSSPECATRISEGFTFKMGSFARLCQATHLISKSLAFCRVASDSSETVSQNSPPEEVRQLCRTLESLVRVNELEVTSRQLAFCSQSSVSHLGILLLQQHYWRQMGHESHHDSTPNVFPETISALETLDRISTTLREGGYDLWQHLEDGRCSLFLVELVYQGMLVLLRMGEIWLAEDVQSKKDSLGWLLSHVGKRWPLVGKITMHILSPCEYRHSRV
ncbi:related to Zn(II)Cys6 transcriptional activator [Fusarium fujikuroi IMI 58289]|uniref:Related to Zn(II)Cys6 transcriptional activator n=1 Tax=Gibberella fujikuroi (strain CBS 195.34 / IMI 58289 / NRRL A-6831) TaxID=1279085 RepID=S0DZW9_GIBF5|nr:related to Zn(II)Cys6 transcriptional activator [Fusarium fujikuroi IMI 58289]CCT68066.1 related to Zn(II)Cys6 transcriptional activator [Fusarium fujikuroi IMI 58289]